jgi:acetoin utilization deacetylase AcuC-like enzyme
MASQLASIHPADHTLFTLEGGYDLEALRDSTASTLRGIAGQGQFGEALASPLEASTILDPIFEAVSRHWSI